MRQSVEDHRFLILVLISICNMRQWTLFTSDPVVHKYAMPDMGKVDSSKFCFAPFPRDPFAKLDCPL